VTRGWIGVQIQPVTPDVADSLGLQKAEGALVAEAQPDSPAAKAGIQSGDVIKSVNGEPVKDARDLAKKIGGIAPDSTVKLALLSHGSDKTVSVTLSQYPRDQEAQASENGSGQGTESHLGLTLAPAESVAGSGSKGVVVTAVDPDGPAAERGFKTGDVILDVAGKAVASPAEVRTALKEARAGGKRTVLMRVKSGEATRFVALPLGNA